MSAQTETVALVAQPGQTESYWQPVPANGYIEYRIAGRQHPSMSDFDTGVQAVAAGCYVREHKHPEQEELIFVFEGRGTAVLDGEETPLTKGSVVYIGKNRRHMFKADPDSELHFFYKLWPGGLDGFFRQIGRPRRPGEPAPEPFPRPENVEQIELETVFARLEDETGR